jgi:alginate O-acetyltransferase complex protein AlgI
MLFNSLEYAIFLVIVFLIYWSIYRLGAFRIVFLLIASYVFYAASNPWFITLLLTSTVTDYFLGRAMQNAHEAQNRRLKKLCLAASLTVNLGLLGTFKYAGFFAESVVSAANLFGLNIEPVSLNIMLPAGISFYTFQTMSYTIDLYRGKCQVERRFLRFAFFVGFFPQLVAGPIVRAVDFLPQIGKKPQLTTAQASRAFWLMGIGLFKKAMADFVAINAVIPFFLAEYPVPGIDPGPLAMAFALFAFTVQIYLDFSAYTDIAMGSALLLGFRLPDNFDRPYKATSIQDFWRRWHMTLGSWLRDYLYYPLGGSRGAQWRTYFNLFVTFVLIGLWHGANMVFVIYGALHALAMCIHRFVRVNLHQRQAPTLDAWGRVWRVALTLNFIVFARAFFRCGTIYKDEGFDTSFDQLAMVWDRLTSFERMTTDWTIFSTSAGRGYEPWVAGLVLACFMVHWTPRAWIRQLGGSYERLPFTLKGAVLAAVLLCCMQIKALPFSYFQF